MDANNTQETLAEIDFFSPTDDYMFKLLFGTEQGVEQLTDFFRTLSS